MMFSLFFVHPLLNRVLGMMNIKGGHRANLGETKAKLKKTSIRVGRYGTKLQGGA